MLKTIKEIKFMKRDGRIEDFNEHKMLSFLEKIGIPEDAAKTLLGDFFEEISTTLRTSEVISALERVASRRITPASPQFEDYAGILYLEGVKNKDYRGKYPHLNILKEASNIRFPETFTEAEIEDLNDYLKPARDLKFNYKAAAIFHSKYCLNLRDVKHPANGSISPIKELPQIAYMRVAMFLTANLPDEERLKECKRIYDNISLHRFTLATPIMVNAMTNRPQTSSCVLMTVGDHTDSILDINRKLGVMSKNIAGVAIDISQLRARGSLISNGVTSGPVPFLKLFEATVTAFNQGGTRPGALCIYYPWYHQDILDLLVLKSNGGTDENRARRLKYALKVNDIFIRKVENDEEIALVSPHEAEDLYGLYSEEFEKAYQKYLDDPNTKKIKAREVWKSFCKQRAETGNIYLFHTDNANKVSMLNEYIGSSNLCTEVFLPSRPSSDFVDVRV